MTIALGLLATDSVVIAADSQETYFGGRKTDVEKILTGFHLKAEAEDDAGAIATSGAGESGYLDYIQEEIVAAFRDHPEETLPEFNNRLKGVMLDFYRD